MLFWASPRLFKEFATIKFPVAAVTVVNVYGGG